MTDARFQDGGEAAISLKAESAADLGVISALVQDAVLGVAEIRYDRRARVLALLINRFRWEDAQAAARMGRPYERARSILAIGGITALRHQGIARDSDTVLSLMALDWEGGAEGAGRIVLTFAGDGALAAEVECLDVTLRDVTRPYLAPSGQAPQHPD